MQRTNTISCLQGLFRVIVAGVIAFSATAALGQPCPGEWHAGDPVVGVTGSVYAITKWDPDGDGPQKPCVVAGGSFIAAGRTLVSNIAIWDETEWRPLAEGFNGNVNALCVLPDNTLVAAGIFTSSGSTACHGIAFWDGVSWSEPAGFPQFEAEIECTALAVHSGKLVVGGRQILPYSTGVLIRQTDAGWESLATDISRPIYALAVMSNGDLVAAGSFSWIDGVYANYVARWNGIAWQPMASGIGGTVLALASLPGGELVAGGSFRAASGAAGNYIVRWNGSAWKPMKQGLVQTIGNAGGVRTISVASDGQIVAAGKFNFPTSSPILNVAKWNGTDWVAPGKIGTYSEYDWVYASLPEPDGSIVFGGYFAGADGKPMSSITRWHSPVWSGLGSASVSDITACLILHDGALIAAGTFLDSSGAASDYLARWEGGVWVRLSSSYIGPCFALAELGNGDVVAAGYLTSAGGIPVNRIARWDGEKWNAMGAGTDQPIRALAVLPSGDLAVGGGFESAGGTPLHNIARWNDSGWSAFGNGLGRGVQRLTVLPNGNLVAACYGSNTGWGVNLFVGEFRNGTWHELGSGFGGEAYALSTLSDGRLVVGGELGTQSGEQGLRNIGVWDGTAWRAIGGGQDGEVTALLSLPGGDLLAAKVVENDAGIKYSIDRWNGSQWNLLATTRRYENSGGHKMAYLGNGELFLGGSFDIVNDRVSPHYAQMTIRFPWIETQPESARTCAREEVAFAVGAGPATAGPFGYRWQLYRDGESPEWIDLSDGPLKIDGEIVGAVSGATADTLLCSRPAGSRHLKPGSAKFRCTISGLCESVVSDVSTWSICAADLQCDGFVSDADFSIFAGAYDVLDCSDPEMPPSCPADFSGDGMVDDADFVIFIAAYNELLCP